MQTLFIGSVLLLHWVCAAQAAAPEWTGQGECRVLVRVDPIDLGDRREDEMVAQTALDFVALVKDAPPGSLPDLSSLQVHRYDPNTGQAQPFKPFETAVSRFDRPCRFEDLAVPDAYPDRAAYSSDHPTGKGPVTIRKRGARLFNREMQNDRGRLSWVHTQAGDAASFYAIYWKNISGGETTGPSPAPWIGDADVYRRKDGQPLAGLAHFTVCAGDLNGDGLFDLVASAEKGDLMWFPNRGERGKPRFVGCRMLMDEDGPIDFGWYGAPFLFDWDNDGLLDVLGGTSHNAILWWKNTGTKTEPKLAYRGFVQSGGKRLEVPESPVPEDTASIFARDYYNQPWIGDWNGDGLPDILTGGYTTGLIFYFRGTGRSADGTPQLTYVGPLEADGAVLDTVWAAAPFAYDFDDDGKMDLLTGSWFWSGIAGQPRPGEVEYLMYYHNVGTTEKPELRREPLPRIGNFPPGDIARPNVVHWDDDGLPDLLVSDNGGALYRFLNKGKPAAPQWEMNSESLKTQWGFVRDSGFTAWADIDGDKKPEMLISDQFRAYEGSPYSPRIVHRGAARVNGQKISHPGPGYGDPYYYTTLTDFDRDGQIDLLWGDQQGHIWLHRGLKGEDPFAFAPGIKLALVDGGKFRVGPEVVDSPAKATDFTILQGSRIIMVAGDFDGDRIDDLAVTETYGNLFIFRNTRTGGTDTFEPGVLVGKVFGGGRTDDLNTVDWNEDGKTDLLIGQTAEKPGTIYLNESTPGKPQFGKPTQPLNLPYMFWGASLKAMDWNADGDEDFMVHSEFYSFFVEKSFLRHGYRPGELLGPMELKPGEGS